MDTFRTVVFRSVLLLITAVPLALAQGTYTQIDYPGAPSTAISGIDSAGDLVGWYQDLSGNYHGLADAGKK